MSFDPIIQVLGNDPPEIMDDVKKQFTNENMQCLIICKKQNFKIESRNTYIGAWSHDKITTNLSCNLSSNAESVQNLMLKKKKQNYIRER